MNRWEKIGGYTQRGKKRTRAGGRCTIERLDDRGGGGSKVEVTDPMGGQEEED